MISESNLRGWLVFVRWNLTAGHVGAVPTHVGQELVDRGWIVVLTEPDQNAEREIRLTDAGKTVSDLDAADWGVRAY